MVVRVQAGHASGNTGSVNFNRVTSLDKWKTDWFHEVSNLFSVTTDQVVTCNENCMTSQCEANSSSMYHARMLQNKAKLNMVISMVERYMKGRLSVDSCPSDAPDALNEREKIKNSNVTPWTMVSPDQVCPVDTHHQSRRKEEKKERRFTIEEVLDEICQEGEALPNTDLESMEYDQLENFMTSSPKPPQEEKQSDEDILARACEIINRYSQNPSQKSRLQDNEKTANSDVKNIAKNETTNIMPELKQISTSSGKFGNPSAPKVIYVQPTRGAQPTKLQQPVSLAIPSSKLGRSISVENANIVKALPQMKPIKLISEKNLSSMGSSSGQILILAPANKPVTCENKRKLPSLSVISNNKSQPIKAAKYIDVIPATLPDGRVIQLEVARSITQTQPVKISTTRGIKHVIIPQRSVNGQLVTKPLNRVLPIRGDHIVLQRSTSPVIIPSKTYSQGVQQNSKFVATLPKETPVREPEDPVQFSDDVPTISLKSGTRILKPTSEIQDKPTENRSIGSPSLTPDSAQTNVETNLSSDSTGIPSSSSVIAVTNIRKRTHDGEMKISAISSQDTKTGNVLVNTNEILEQVDSSPEDSVQDKGQTAGEDELNISLLNELMDQISSPNGDEEYKCLNEDLLDYLMPETQDEQEETASPHSDASEPTSQNVHRNKDPTPAVTTVMSGNQYDPTSLMLSQKPVTSIVYSESRTTPFQGYTVQVDGNNDSIRKTSTEVGDSKRRVLSTINGNEESLKNIYEATILKPKPKRKYSKSGEAKSKTGPKPLGPTAAAAAKNPYHKPPLQYNILIYLAFKDSNFEALSVKRIYSFILKTFPYFQHAHPTWQNAIRHQLCCCKVYEKVPEMKGEPGNEQTTGRSSWRILNEECIKKLKDDAVCAVMKKNSAEKIRISLSNQDDFSAIFEDIFAAAERKNNMLEAKARNCQSAWQANSTFNQYKKEHEVATKESWILKSEQNIMEISPPMSCDSDEDDVSAMTFDDLQPYSSLFFDVVPKTIDTSSIFSV